MARVQTTLVFALVTVLLAFPGMAQAQTIASVTGTLTHTARIALPDNAIVTIQIAEIGANGNNRVIAEQRFSTGGRQVPFSFALPYDTALIDANRAYTLQANISVNGQVTFTPVTGGNLPPTSGGALPLLIVVLLVVAAGGIYLARTRLIRPNEE
jgi:putative lipoprotein